MNSEQNKMVGRGAASEVRATASEGDDPVTTSPVTTNDAVIREVSSWEGVSVREHRMGGVEFRSAFANLATSTAQLPTFRSQGMSATN